ncbi:MAG: phosphonate ABC transporter ATP-binding protein [Clostridia bacterium]|nr:phosphonate ABC transporter ATP-binding protein [Clostridia bacterium]
MEVIIARELTKKYPGGITGLDGLTVKINQGEMVGILGPSGAGKTTFFRLLTGVITPSEGELTVLGRPIGRITNRALSRLRSRMGVVYQHHNVIPAMSVARNVLMGLLGQVSLIKALRMLFHLTKDEKAAVEEVLARLDLSDKLYSRCDELSGGQQQRVAVARALLADPELILADEPIASVDPRTAQLILDQFLRLNREKGKTVVLNLHQVDFALKYCTRLLVLRQGKLVYDGDAAGFKETHIYNQGFALDSVEDIDILEPVKGGACCEQW